MIVKGVWRMRIVLPTGFSSASKRFSAVVWPISATRVAERTSASLKFWPSLRNHCARGDAGRSRADDRRVPVLRARDDLLRPLMHRCDVDHVEIAAHRADRLRHGKLPALADRHHQHHRADADHHPEHGQRRAHGFEPIACQALSTTCDAATYSAGCGTRPLSSSKSSSSSMTVVVRPVSLSRSISS